MTKKVISIWWGHMYIWIPDVKFPLLFVWATEQIKEKYQNGCYLKTTRQNN